MIAIFIFFVTMLVYLMTIAPTLSFFDSGEMIAGAYTLGVSHPPGYPVYVTLGKLFSYLPFGSVAFRVNLMSSFFAAMTSVMIYYITRAMLNDSDDEGFVFFKGLKFSDVAGIFSALAFAFSYNLWAWAVVSKFYTLNAFVVACILMLLIRWRRARMEEGSGGGGHSLSYLYTIAFLFGIAAVVHISQFVLIPVYLLYILIVDGSAVLGVPEIKKLIKEPLSYVILAVFIALELVAYLNPQNISLQMIGVGSFALIQILAVIASYKKEKLLVPVSLILAMAILLEIAIYHVPDRLNNLLVLGPFALLTAYLFVRETIKFKVVAIMSFFFLLGHSIYLHVPIRAAQEPLINWGGATNWTQFKWVYNREGYPTVGGERSWSLLWKQMQSFDLVREFTWAGIPIMLMGLWGHFKKDWRHFTILVFGSLFMTAAIIIGGNPIEENIFLLQQFYIPVYIFLCIIMGGTIYVALNARPKNIMMATIVLLVVIAYPASELKAHYWENDRSKNFIAYDMGNAELNFAPQFDVLFTWGDSGAFPMWYLQDVERKRPDILLVHTPHLPLAWFLKSLRRGPARLGDISQIKDYRWLRNYNGLKGISEFLAIPEDLRDPAALIRQIAVLNPERQFCFDYSSRYSVDMPFDTVPYAITYQKLRKDFIVTNQREWAYLVTRGLPDPTIALDSDETKAVSIYGYVHADLGKQYLDMGRPGLARPEFIQAVRYAPELWGSVARYIK
jgi:Protein O-mannosyl-transferase TMEM260-like